MPRPVRHPAWCDPRRCEVSAERPGATHCSRPVFVGPYPPGTLVAEISAAQGPPVSGYPFSGRPYVTLALHDGEGELCLAPMSAELALALGRVLTGFARQVAV